jgi:hypothetical protein
MPSSYGGYGSLYSSSKYNPRNVQPESYEPGRVYSPISNYLSSHGSPVNPTTLQGAFRSAINYRPDSSAAPSMPSLSGLSGGSSGGWGGGGGGGGGGGAGGITQAQLDWITRMLSKGQVDPLKASRLKLPAFRSKFRPQMYDQLMGRFNQAVGRDTRTANQSYNQLDRFLRSNYTNAFTNPNAAYGTMQGAPGMSALEMARVAQNQGVNPATVATQLEGGAAADQAFGNLWNVLGANENVAQRNRLTAAMQDRQATQNALAIAALQGRTGIGLQKAGAKEEWRTRKEDTNYQRRLQQALQNWQQRNQVAATNVQNDVAYRNSLMQALMGMVPSLAQGVALPDVNEVLGLAPGGRGGRGRRNEPERTPRETARRHRYRAAHKGGGK